MAGSTNTTNDKQPVISATLRAIEKADIQMAFSFFSWLKEKALSCWILRLCVDKFYLFYRQEIR